MTATLALPHSSIRMMPRKRKPPTGVSSSMPTTTPSDTQIPSSTTSSTRCAGAAVWLRCYTRQTMARTSSTTVANCSSTPRPVRRTTSFTCRSSCGLQRDTMPSSPTSCPLCVSTATSPWQAVPHSSIPCSASPESALHTSLTRSMWRAKSSTPPPAAISTTTMNR